MDDLPVPKLALNGRGGSVMTDTCRLLRLMRGKRLTPRDTTVVTYNESSNEPFSLTASYLVNNATGQTLADFLDKQVFADNSGIEIAPTAEDVAGFNAYIKNYKAGLPIEEAATKCKQ